MLPPLCKKPSQCNGCISEHSNEGFACSKQVNKCDIMIIGLASGETESRKGEPFSGGSGSMLRAMLRQAGITNTYLTTLVKCRPWREGTNKYVKSNRIPTKEEIRSCTGRFLEQELHTTEPILIIPIGDEVVSWLFHYCGQQTPGPITNIRGYVFTLRDPISNQSYKVLPIVDPHYIAQANPEYWSITVHDLKKALQESYSREYKEVPENFIIAPTMQLVAKTIKFLLDNKLPISLDLETLGLDLYSVNIMCIGIAWSDTNAICIPFLKRGGYPYWKDTDELGAWYYICQLLDSENTKITQNGFPFDFPILKYLGCQISGRCEDTLTQHHTVALELPHSLEFLASTYTRKRAFKGEAKGLSNMLWRKDEDMWIYNCRDCVATWTTKFAIDKELNKMEMKIW